MTTPATKKYDLDVHAMEPKSLWPEKWQQIWTDDQTFVLDDYLRHLDNEKCDVGMFLPTRGLFMDGFNARLYNEWARDFCRHSDGRLVAAEWCDGSFHPASFGRDPIVARPEDALQFVHDVLRPTIVHSVTRLRYSKNFHVDHALAHVVDAMKFVAELSARDVAPTCNIAMMECGTWWVRGLKRALIDEKLRVPWGKLWFGADVRDDHRPMKGYDEIATDNEVHLIFGSDFPHYDQQDVSKLRSNRTFLGALNFLGEMEA